MGIGVVTATFAAVNAFVHPPSDAIADPEGLVAIFTSDTDGGLYGRNSYLDFESLGGRVEAIEALASHRLGIVRFEADDSTSQLMAEIVSGNYFRVLGVEMALDRGFLDSEAVVGSADAVAVVSHRLWQEELGGTPDVLGSIQRIDGREFVVIGVAPQDLASRFLAIRTDVWVPIGIPGGVFRSTESELADRADRNYGVVARLRPNATLTEVQAQLDTVAGGLHALDEVAWSDRQGRPRRFTALEEAAARVPPNFLAALTLATWIFIGAAVLVLVIACSNVAGILLARAERRRTEIAVRSALGASRRRLLGMLLAESAILASMAGVVGVLFSAWLVQRFDSISLPIGDVSLQFDLRLDGRVLLFAVALSALTALAFGLAPALRGTRAELVPALKAATGEGGGRRRLGMRGVSGGNPGGRGRGLRCWRGGGVEQLPRVR